MCKAILLQWKDSQPPTQSMLLKLINEAFLKNKLIYSRHACPRKFSKIWNLWLEAMNNPHPSEINRWDTFDTPMLCDFNNAL